MAEKSALIEPVMYTQSDLKDVKDVTKNLVSGDFERQYRGGVMEKGRGRRVTVALTAAVTVLGLWLLALTLTRELQLTRLRRQVDELSANVIALSANVKSLNQQLANNRLFNEFQTMEDTIYADDDDNEGTVIHDHHADPDTDKDQSLEKLHDVTTVLEDDDTDDEDLYDDDEEESGDYYQDYDRRRGKLGSTNMVRLKPEDFTDAVISFEKEQPSVKNNIQELKRLLNENPENPNIGFPPMAPTTTTESPRSKRSVFPDAEDSEPSVPRFIGKPEDRRKTKKYARPSLVEAIAVTPSTKTLHTVTRTVRSEENRGRPFIAAHFHGNTTHLNTDVHENYKGNGLLRVNHGAPHDVWYPSPWTVASPHPRPTLTRNGHVHVHHTGVYLVYVQIYYLDAHDIISWVLHRTNADIDGRETLLQCAQSSHSPEPMDKPNSCFSAAALFLKAGDRLAVRNTGGDRHSLMQPEKSFIGLIKLADAEDPTEEF